ncbi:Protein CBG15859 [Caenorhabditis briggsae]|uniref:Protein CBG15859 n=1 Tax=Caenorhabditis briggsae TaxID=6238 RepID=A8XMV6_CAEBR|nr:Protein CBG15859 [Caenorhabditis briggsae]CAP33981.2 Protein CBG15859 [Caenorhabditis briggsae]
MRGVPTLLLLIGLSSVRPEKSIIDRLIANQATNSEQKIVLESVATILSWSPTQYFKYELVKIVEKNLRNPTNIGGNVSEKAIDNIREVFKNSKNPLTVVEFLEICMDFLKTSNNNETPPPIIDRMIENEADLMEKRLILFELKTIMNFAVKSSSYKHTLYTLIRKNKKYEDPDYVGGPISMQAIRNIQNALKMSENPKAFLEFLDICMDFLKSPATTNSPKWMVLHEAVTIIDKGYSIEEVKKSLMDVPSNVLESIFEALGIPVLLDTTPDDSTVTPTTVATDSPDLSGEGIVTSAPDINDYNNYDASQTAIPYWLENWLGFGDDSTTTESPNNSDTTTTVNYWRVPGRGSDDITTTESPTNFDMGSNWLHGQNRKLQNK